MSAAAAIGPGRRPDRLRLGFVGLGWIGRKRLDAIGAAPDVHIAAIADNDEGKLQSAHSAWPQARAARDLDELLKCDLDGVVIATPNASHAAQSIACLSRGLPVFCQKPLAIDARQAQDVIAAASAADRLLGVDFCYRSVQGMGELRRRILGGELGELLAMDLTFHNAYGPDKPWAYDRRLSGGGCLLDLGVHLIDLALWLLGEPDPAEPGRSARLSLVSSRLFAGGRAARADGGPVEDMAFAEFRANNGAVVRVACSWKAHAGRDAVIGMELLGTKGGAAWRNVGGSFYDFTVDVFHGRSSQRIGAPPDEWGPRVLNAWLRRLREDRSFDPDAMLFARGAQLIEAIYRS